MFFNYLIISIVAIKEKRRTKNSINNFYLNVKKRVKTIKIIVRFNCIISNFTELEEKIRRKERL